MAILIDSSTKALVQGITGKEGSRAAREMIAYGTNVLAGVTPGKGGQTTEEGVPVFNTVKEALAQFPDINTSLIVVPAQFVLGAAMESMEAKIPLVNIITEKVPISHVAKMIAFARTNNITLVGPSSIGILSPKKSKVGSIGSAGLADIIFSPGHVGVVSKSGGMTAELSRILTEAGIGQSTVVGIGGDLLIGYTFEDAGLAFEQDPETKAIVIFGEVGGTYEECFAKAMGEGRIRKPVVALIAGQFSEQLPQDTVLGHAGAIVTKGRGSAASKIDALRKAGALIANTPEEIPILLKPFLL
ncbi:MAG: succinate--CoA ligase subunit alpha [bacterium]|nr:succinate--CoA ligase subunit alpha [bacterium]